MFPKTLLWILRSKKSRCSNGKRTNEEMIKISPGKTHISYETPRRLLTNMFSMGKLTIIKIMTGIMSTKKKPDKNLFFHNQRRLFKRAIINLIPFLQIPNPINL